MQDINVILLKNFQRSAQKLLSAKELDDFIHFIAEYPEQGAIIQGSGGLRKIRWAYGNKGKSGGARIIYYYFKTEFEVYLTNIYAKNEKDNISKSELKILAKLIEELKNER